MKKILFIWSIALSSIYSFAGEVTGVVKDLTSNKVVDNGTVTIYNSGSRRTTQIQINGDYSFTGISAGTYTVTAFSEGKVDTVTDVVVNTEGVTYLDLRFAVELPGIIFSEKRKYPNPSTITTDKDFKQTGIRKVEDVAALSAGVTQTSDGEISIKGSRPTSTRTMIDGVYSECTVPVTAIKYVRVYTAGIPAKFGDTSGGIIYIETKSYFD